MEKALYAACSMDPCHTILQPSSREVCHRVHFSSPRHPPSISTRERSGLILRSTPESSHFCASFFSLKCILAASQGPATSTRANSPAAWSCCILEILLALRSSLVSFLA